jgi:sterol desaturase/sphingolipid hydroxylase (fatty acid hydroxylase superfamily)
METHHSMDWAAVDWASGLTTFVALYAIMVARYFMVSGLFYWLLWMRPPEKVTARKLTDVRPRAALIRSEIRWSLISSAIYTIPGAIIIEAWKMGATALYLDVSDYGWAYLFVSLAFYLFLHDTWFYWTHRMMHVPKIFKLMHRVHHDSLQPTPWAAFSFHPYEAIIGAIAVPVLVFFVPLHVGALMFMLIFMTVTGVLNHTGYEILPDSWLRSFVGAHFISAAHHNLHHQRYRCNYALYFRFWDKLMGTDIMETEYDFLQSPGDGAQSSSRA